MVASTDAPSTRITSWTHGGIRLSTYGRHFSSLRAGITTLTGWGGGTHSGNPCGAMCGAMYSDRLRDPDPATTGGLAPLAAVLTTSSWSARAFGVLSSYTCLR